MSVVLSDCEGEEGTLSSSSARLRVACVLAMALPCRRGDFVGEVLLGEQKRKSCSHESLTNEAEVATFAMEMCSDISSVDRGRLVPSDQGNMKHHSASRAMARSS